MKTCSRRHALLGFRKTTGIMLTTALLYAGLASCSYDDGELWNSITDLEQRVETLEETVTRLNADVGAMQSLVNALHGGHVITRVEETADGYALTFSDGNTIAVRHGTAGADAPAIGVGEFEGVYYWTLTTGGNTAWLTGAQGEKLPVAGGGVTPVIAVDADGYWTVNGARVADAHGAPIKAAGEAGDSFFSSVAHDDLAVTLTLKNGSTLVVPKAGSLTLTVAGGDALYIQCGSTETYAVTQSGVETISISKPDGWKASISNGKLMVTAPPAANAYAERTGTISIVAVGKNTTIIKNITVSARDYNYVIDFENAADYLAGPTSYGENLYDDSYAGYDDPSGLLMMINESYGSRVFWNGGVAVSQWNDMTDGQYTNQCSVYYRDPTTGNGGCQGSRTFAVGFGYNDPVYMGDTRSAISFYDNETECVFDHFYVANSTYAYLSMTTGDWAAKQFSYADHDWFKLVIEGFDKHDVSTGTLDVYLADFREPHSPGIAADWMRVDLSPLGSVSTLKFDLQSSDTGAYGMNTPAYFCFDNLAVRLATLP
ncbi:MAG: DUF4988 and DUF4465 domain-containing protein [Prevotellaceae bacterium]|nr:DUF4988 and DUF4465 domain-containing protein [Prevotellaceae bacterium]